MCLVSKLNSLKGEINAKRVTIRGEGGGGEKGKRFSRGGSEGMVEKEERRKDK